MQSKKQSLIETVGSVLIGYVVALISQLAIFPMFGIHISISSNLGISAWFTVISLIRSYIVRRCFNKLHKVKNDCIN